MKKASVSILKARLSQYLAAVKSGEEVIVTERGRPIARLAPIGKAEVSFEGRTEMLIREGRLRPPAADARSRKATHDVPKDPEGRTLAALLEEREGGR